MYTFSLIFIFFFPFLSSLPLPLHSFASCAFCKHQRYLKDPDNEDHSHLFDLISKLLTYEPSQRYTLRQAMRHPFFLPYQRDAYHHHDNVRSDSATDRCRSHSLSRWRYEAQSNSNNPNPSYHHQESYSKDQAVSSQHYQPHFHPDSHSDNSFYLYEQSAGRQEPYADYHDNRGRAGWTAYSDDNGNTTRNSGLYSRDYGNHSSTQFYENRLNMNNQTNLQDQELSPRFHYNYVSYDHNNQQNHHHNSNNNNDNQGGISNQQRYRGSFHNYNEDSQWMWNDKRG